MGKKNIRLTALVSSAVVLFSAAAGMSARADDDSAPRQVSETYSADEFIEYLDEPFTPDDDIECITRTLNGSCTGGDSKFLELCSGNKWGYNDMLRRSNSAMRREMYDELYEKCCAVWNSTDEFAFSTQTNSVGYHGFFKIDNSARNMTKNEAVESYYTFLYDNPEFYFLTTYIGVYSDSSILVYTSDEHLTAARRAEYQQMIKDCCADSVKLVSREKTTYTNSVALHDMICGDMEFNNTTSDHFTAHNVLGGISEHEGVCESYAKLYRMLLNYNGIENVFVAGSGNGDGHAWNMLRLDDGNYYFTDLTWDDQNRNRDYHCTGTAFFEQDHTADKPSQTGQYFLYKLPDVPSANFSLDAYFKSLAAEMDLNSDGRFNKQDIKTLQNRLTDSSKYGTPADINGDGKLNNRDLKELQMLLKRYMNRA